MTHRGTLGGGARIHQENPNGVALNNDAARGDDASAQTIGPPRWGF